MTYLLLFNFNVLDWIPSSASKDDLVNDNVMNNLDKQTLYSFKSLIKVPKIRRLDVEI